MNILKTTFVIFIFLCAIWFVAGAAVFQWRNPNLNSMQVMRHLPEVLTFRNP